MAYTNSQLISYMDLNCEMKAPRSLSVSRVTIHCAEGNFTLSDYSNILRMGPNSTWNYAISTDGSIGLFAEEQYMTNGTGDSENDAKTINVQVSTINAEPPWTISPLVLTSLYNLCEDIARRNGIPLFRFDSMENSNITLHRWYAPDVTECPYDDIESKIYDIVKVVNNRLKSKTPSPELSRSYRINPTIIGNTTDSGSQSGSGVYNPYSSKSGLYWTYLDIESKLTPYILTANRNATLPNLSKASGVCGVLLEAGYLYSVNHIKQTFRNPNLTRQIKAVKSAKLATSFYMIGRAHTIKEAQSEIDEFYKILRINESQFGVWIIPENNQSKSLNDKILNAYRDRLGSYGYRNKIGLYSTKSQLNNISWNIHQSDWWLWLNSHVNTESQLTDRVDNTFFEV